MEQDLPAQAAPSIFALMQPGKRSGWRNSAIGALPIVGLIAMLLALAFLQLRWSAKVSEAERASLQQNLDRSSRGFQAAFARDLLEICQTLQDSQPRDQAALIGNLLNRYEVWGRVNRHAALIEGLYIRPRTGGVMRLDPQARAFEPSSLPVALPAFANHATGSYAIGPPSDPNDWVWNEQAATLVHPLYIAGAQHPRYFGTLFVVFRVPYLEQAYLPELGRRYFPSGNGFVFQLVANAGGKARVVYQSDSHTAAQPFLHPDATVPLLDVPLVYRPSGTSPDRVSLSAADVSRWQLAVRPRSGSVDAAVVHLRQRNLAVSIVVLLLLLVSLITILIATRRARRLARLQMEFASGISHELRTPLTVIRSAAENLADGVVSGPERVADYGELIHKESQRLSWMVDHILDFARLHADPGYRMEPVSVADVFEQVLSSESPLFLAAGIDLDVDLADDLPLLLTDAQAVAQCLQNLLSNALKYGSDGRRIALTALPAREDGQLRVLITVKDFGAGIAPEDLPHICEPFFRSASARASQVAGTGLGLSLTRKMMKDLGGRITVESSPGKGSKFTLHVPASAAPAE